MNTSTNNYDTLEELIYKEGIRIQAVDIHHELDLLLILLNTGGILKESLSKYPLLKNASKESLLNYEFIGSGTGIHWPDLDEDLSLKGFLKSAILNQVSRVK
jgi:hypothetical protein